MKQWIFAPMLLLLAACGHSPDPDYYSLMPVTGTVMNAPATTIKIERPTLPGYLDRPQLVAQHGDYETTIDEMNRWSEPLDTMLARMIETDVQQRLPSSLVLTEENGALENPRFIVALSVERFNQIADGQAALTGELIVKDKNSAQPPEHKPIDFTTDTHSSSPSVAAALSTLAGNAADAIAATIVALDQRGNR